MPELEPEPIVAEGPYGWRTELEKARGEIGRLQSRIRSLEKCGEELLCRTEAIEADALFVARQAEENAWPHSDVAIAARRLIAALTAPDEREATAAPPEG